MENIHIGEGNVLYNNFCTTCNNHMTMQHTCAGHPSRHPNRVLPPVYCGSMEHSSSQCHNRSWDNREQLPVKLETSRNQEFQSANSENLGKAGFQSSNAQGRPSQLHSHRSYSKILGSAGSYQPNRIIIIINFLGETRTTSGDQRKKYIYRSWSDTPLESSRVIMLIIPVQILGIMGTSQEDQHSPMLGLMRDTTSSTLHPYTHLHLH